MSGMEKHANWLYFIGTKQNPTETFVYGLSLSTKCDIEYSLNMEDKGSIEPGKHLYLFRSVKIVSAFIENDNIDLTKFYSDEKHALPNRQFIDFVQSKQFIQKHESCSLEQEVESPIHSLVNMTSYYTKEFFELNLDAETQINLLKKLSEDSNQPFYGNYAKRIGCLEIAETQKWAEKNLPFYIDYDKDKKQYSFVKTGDFDEDVHLVFKHYHSMKEKAYERLVFIPQGSSNVPLDTIVDDDWGYKYSIYNKNGDLLHEDCSVFIKQISLNGLMLGSSIKIQDKFSKRDQNLGEISTSSEFNTVVKNRDIDKEIEYLNTCHDTLSKLVDDNKVSDKEGRWFDKSEDLIGDIINHLNSLHRQSSQIIIADPWADEDMPLLAIRLKTSNIKIISTKKANINKIKKIKEQLQNIGGRTQYHFINKEFHDRFIMFKTGDETEVYCLPNSINAMLKNDDFLILRLNGKVKLQAISHINQLHGLCNDGNLLENLKDAAD